MSYKLTLDVDDVLKRTRELYAADCQKRSSPFEAPTPTANEQMRALAAALVEEANAVVDCRLDDIKEWVRDNFQSKWDGK